MSPLAAVTGATGFVGAQLAALLVERGFRVRALHREASPLGRLAGLDVERVVADVTAPASLEAAFLDVEVVFHVAGVVSYRTRDRHRMEQVNVEGTRNVLAAARAAGVERLVHTSSVVAIGASARPAILDEDAPWNLGALRGAYFDTKRRGEALVMEAARAGFPAVVVNPAAVLGPGDSRGNLHQLVRMILRRGVALVPPGGVNAVDNRDVAHGHLLALERGRDGERYILGHENLTFTDFALRLAAVLGNDARVLRLPRPLILSLRAAATILDPLFHFGPPLTPATTRSMGRYFWFSISKAARDLGYAPRPVDDALRGAVESLRGGPENAS